MVLLVALTIYTWKNSLHGNAYRKPLGSMLFGGNVGHAAIELTWPADKKGDKLAKKYEGVEGLTISKRTETIRKKQPDGSFKPEKQVVYFAYFSWWPGQTNGHHINRFSEDKEAEWENERGKLGDLERTQLYGQEGPPPSSITTVNGALIKKKEIVKVKTIELCTLKGDISDDLAYQQLTAEKKKLEAEHAALWDKSKKYMEEMEKASKEKRDPDARLSLTKKENDRIGKLMDELKRVESQLEICKQDFDERHKLEGRTPDDRIEIPTNLDSHRLRYSLDAKSVLDKMAELSKSKKSYKFKSFNCSTAALDVISVGVSTRLKGRMQRDGIDIEKIRSKTKIATPTGVFKLGLKLQKELIHLSYIEARKDYKKSLSKIKNENGKVHEKRTERRM